MRRVMLAGVAAVLLAAAGCGGGGAKHHGPTTHSAEKAQRDILARALRRQGSRAGVSAVACIRATTRRSFRCSVRLSTGRRFTTAVVFAANGNARIHRLR